MCNNLPVIIGDLLEIPERIMVFDKFPQRIIEFPLPITSVIKFRQKTKDI